MLQLARVELKWTDFDGVLKILPRRGAKPPVEASPGFATESMTAITWFGVRTGFDARRFVAKGRLLRADGWKQEFEKLSGVAILYATKVLSYYLRLHFDDVFAASKPLVIFETGGSGDADIDDWVATNEGIVIASARAALKNWFGVDTEDKIPHDMFGRYWQIKLLLEALPNNAFPQGSPLARARALVVTLGEVGALYWERTNPEWQWCFAKSFEEHSKQGFADAVTLPLEEIRDALGCGDCSRAGFVASMACSLGFRPPDQDLPPQSLSLAVASLNWFGIQKLRYFGMDRYIKFLAREADGFWEKWRASPSGTQKQFGTEPFETLDTRPALEKKTGQLDVTLGGWLAKFDPEKPAEIQKLSNKWSSTRRESRPI